MSSATCAYVPTATAAAAAALGTAQIPEVVVTPSPSGGAVHVLLERQKKLNALSHPMIGGLVAGFERAKQGGCSVLLMEGAGRAFCAGGDVAAVRAASLEVLGADAGCTAVPKGTLPYDFFHDEYAMNALVGAADATAQVSIWDGVTMGGGVGLSVHGRYRVATEKTLMAKPETKIGLFPDVGGSYMLSRLPRNLGYYAGLTGARLRAADLMYAGIATHALPSDAVEGLRAKLLAMPPGQPAESVGAILDAACAAAPLELETSQLETNGGVIERCFGGGHSVEGIVERLQADGGEFALVTAQTLAQLSPTSLKLTHELIRRAEAGSLSLNACLNSEFRVCQRLVSTRGGDFFEGVRAVIISS